MAKHQGITIRIGAAYDRVEVPRSKLGDSMGNPLPPIIFDRAQMRKDGNRKLVDRLRHEVRDTWADLHGFRKDKGAKRHQNVRKDKARREATA